MLSLSLASVPSNTRILFFDLSVRLGTRFSTEIQTIATKRQPSYNTTSGRTYYLLAICCIVHVVMGNTDALLLMSAIVIQPGLLK